MGLFRVRGRLTGPTGRGEDAELLVDTGATLLVVPRSLAERLELAARRSQPVLIIGGQREPAFLGQDHRGATLAIAVLRGRLPLGPWRYAVRPNSSLAASE